MPTPAERLKLLLEVHDDSLRSAAERCGLDHTTLMGVRNRETENSATLDRIASAYGVPASWVRGERDLVTDFVFSVLSRPLAERVSFLWEPNRRAGYALTFLSQYHPGEYTCARLAGLVRLPEADIEGILEGEPKLIPMTTQERLSSETGLPLGWFRTGLVGREDEEELLIGLAEWALSTLALDLGVDVTQEEIREATLALV